MVTCSFNYTKAKSTIWFIFGRNDQIASNILQNHVKFKWNNLNSVGNIPVEFHLCLFIFSVLRGDRCPSMGRFIGWCWYMVYLWNGTECNWEILLHNLLFFDTLQIIRIWIQWIISIIISKCLYTKLVLITALAAPIAPRSSITKPNNHKLIPKKEKGTSLSKSTQIIALYKPLGKGNIHVVNFP